MPLSILAITGVGMWVLGTGLVASLLLAASLAPTDPVLAADVQVGGPKEGGEDITLPSAHRDHEFQRDMHDITEQVERIAMMLLLLAFGGSLITGLPAPVGWTEILAAVLILFVVRPIAGVIGMIGCKASRSEKLSIAFFGIRGEGSFYYLAYGLNHGEFENAERLWTILSLVVAMSIIMHGLTVTPVLRWLDRSQGRDPDKDSVPQPGQGPGAST